MNYKEFMQTWGDYINTKAFVYDSEHSKAVRFPVNDDGSDLCQQIVEHSNEFVYRYIPNWSRFLLSISISLVLNSVEGGLRYFVGPNLCVYESLLSPHCFPSSFFQYASSNTRVVNQVRIRRDHFQRFVTDLRGGRYAVDLDRLLMVRENTLESLAFVSDVVITAMRML